MTFALEPNLADYITECLRAYNHIDIFTAKENEEAQKAADVLLFSLKHFGKNANLKSFSLTTQTIPLHQSLPDKNIDRADFLISIKEGGTKLAQLFYEKTESGLNLFLKTKGKALKKEDIILQPLWPEKLLICVGFPSLVYLNLGASSHSYFVINIDNSSQNENFGDINIVYPGEQLSIIVFQIIKEITKDFWQSQFADQHRQSEGEHKEKTLLLKAVSNLVWKAQKELLYCSLSLKDFSAIGAIPKNLAFVLKQIANGPFLFQRFLLLWEQNSSPLAVKGVFFARQKDNTLNVLSQHFTGQTNTNGQVLLFNVGHTVLEKAEKEIDAFL